MEIGFLLAAVAEHSEVIRVLPEPLVEIEHMPVGVAFAHDRDKAEDIAFEAKTLRVSLDQALAGELRGAVERGLQGKGSVLRSGNDLGFAIDRAGGRKSDPLDAVGAHRLEDIEGGKRVLLEILV